MSFLENEHNLETLKPLFKSMVDLKNIEDPKIQELVDDAIKHPENYVLKPQKEGGGNNYFNEEMREILIKKEKEHLVF